MKWPGRSISLVSAFSLIVGSLICQSPPSPVLAEAGAMERLIEELLVLPTNREELPRISRPGPDAAADTPEPNAGAAIEEHLQYWYRRHQTTAEEMPNSVRSRILAKCEEKPEWIPNLLPLLPTSEATHDVLYGIYQQHRKELGEAWGKKVSEFLRRNSKYFRSELLQFSANARDGEHWVHNEDDLLALARLDWNAAEALLQRFSRGDQPRLVSLSLGTLYAHSATSGDESVVVELRERLRSIAEDRKAPGVARDSAIAALLETEWLGREQWFQNLFADESLFNLSDGSLSLSALSNNPWRTPERYIQFVAGLVGNPNRTVHNNAVRCLVRFHLDSARRDALEPLIPWLKDKNWSDAQDRLRLIQSLDQFDIPGTIDGLIAVLDEDDTAEQAHAADSLKHFRTATAIPALRRAIATQKQFHYRVMILSALDEAGGITNDEAVSGIEALARVYAHPNGQEQFEDSLHRFGGESPSVELSLGYYLSGRAALNEEVARVLVDRAGQLEKESPVVARELWRILDRWETSAMDAAFLNRLKTAHADALTVQAGLAKRASIRRNHPNVLKEIVESGGFAGGVAATILEDSGAAERILAGSKREERLAVLACARLTGFPLPLAAVGVLARDEDSLLAKAAESYLVAADNPESKTILEEIHRGDVRILGRRSANDPGHHAYTEFDRREEMLLQLILGSHGPEEVFALLTAGYWGNAGQIYVYVRGNSAQVVFEDVPARSYTRDMTASELSTLREYLARDKVDDLEPFDSGWLDGLQVEFVHLTRSGGRRVFMNNPRSSRDNPWSRLIAQFQELRDGHRFQVRHQLAEAFPGARVLLSDLRWALRSVSVENSAIVLNAHYLDRLEDPLFEVEGAGKLGWAKPAIAEPRSGETSYWGTWPASESPAIRGIPDCGVYGMAARIAGFEAEAHHNQNSWAQRNGDRCVVAGKFSRKVGLWLLGLATEPQLIAEGEFSSPILSADGKLVIAAHTATDWSHPNDLVTVDLNDRRIKRVPLDSADNLLPITRLPNGKVLILRARSTDPDYSQGAVGPTKAEFWLLDTAGGNPQRADGYFEPLQYYSIRAPQQTEKPGELWAIDPDLSGLSTTIGRYDSHTFKFAPVLKIPVLLLDASALWVDSQRKLAYILYANDLIQIPLIEPAP